MPSKIAHARPRRVAVRRRRERAAPAIPRPEAIAASGPAPLTGDVGVKLMLGVGGITACVVLRKA